MTEMRQICDEVKSVFGSLPARRTLNRNHINSNLTVCGMADLLGVLGLSFLKD